jgi:hypothetical protein
MTVMTANLPANDVKFRGSVSLGENLKVQKGRKHRGLNQTWINQRLL